MDEHRAILSESEVDRIIDNDIESEFYKLRGVPGHCLDALSWEEAKKLIEDGSVESLGQMGRRPAATVVYHRFRRKVLEEYGGMVDYVKITVVNFPYKLNKDGRKVVDTSVEHTFDPLWRPNDFPYNYEDGIEHHNLWARSALPHETIVKYIEENRKGWDYVYFVNPPVLASIPGLWHAHILSRRQQ